MDIKQEPSPHPQNDSPKKRKAVDNAAGARDGKRNKKVRLDTRHTDLQGIPLTLR
jgi:hypothetical protein